MPIQILIARRHEDEVEIAQNQESIKVLIAKRDTVEPLQNAVKRQDLGAVAVENRRTLASDSIYPASSTIFTGEFKLPVFYVDSTSSSRGTSNEESIATSYSSELTANSSPQKQSDDSQSSDWCFLPNVDA